MVPEIRFSRLPLVAHASTFWITNTVTFGADLRIHKGPAIGLETCVVLSSATVSYQQTTFHIFCTDQISILVHRHHDPMQTSGGIHNDVCYQKQGRIFLSSLTRIRKVAKGVTNRPSDFRAKLARRNGALRQQRR